MIIGRQEVDLPYSVILRHVSTLLDEITLKQHSKAYVDIVNATLYVNHFMCQKNSLEIRTRLVPQDTPKK